jgi:hypothetical protein
MLTLEGTRLAFEVLGGAQPGIPDRRVPGALGKLAVPTGEIAQLLGLIHARRFLSCERTPLTQRQQQSFRFATNKCDGGGSAARLDRDGRVAAVVVNRSKEQLQQAATYSLEPSSTNRWAF